MATKKTKGGWTVSFIIQQASYFIKMSAVILLLYLILILTGSFKRSHRKEENPFTLEQRTIIEYAIHQLNKVLLQAQKETLPLDLYEYYNDS